MRLAILSDIHDHVWNLDIVLREINADAILICGDLCSPFVLDMITERFKGPIHIVLGNNDGDLFRIMPKTNNRVIMHGEFAELVEFDGQLIGRITYENMYHLDFFDREHGGIRIGINHFPHIAQSLVASKRYDVVCHGHTHLLGIETQDSVLSINPGSLMGYKPSTGETIPPTYVYFDTDTRETQSIEITYKVEEGRLIGKPAPLSV